MNRFAEVKEVNGKWEGVQIYLWEPQKRCLSFVANPSLFIIHEAWEKGLDLEAEADGYGEGFGTNGDWSGIRDSSQVSKDKMLTKALNYLFGGDENV